MPPKIKTQPSGTLYIKDESGKLKKIADTVETSVTIDLQKANRGNKVATLERRKDVTI